MPTNDGSIPDDEFLRVAALLPDPVFTAKEVTEHLPISNQAVNKRLNKLEENDLIASKRVGAAAVVYWLTPAGKQKVGETLSEWRQSSESQ